MSDIYTRLLLNTKDYETKLGKAKNSTTNFTSSIQGKLVSAVGKFATGIGIAVGATETFSNIIKSSQGTNDAWNNSLSACKDTVNLFFQSISSGDWSGFSGGLMQTLGNMRELAQLRDMLGDAKLTMDFDTRQFEREYVRLEGIIDDETKTKSEREKAFSDMKVLIADFKDRVEKTGKGAAETLVKEMNSKFNKNFTLGDIERYIKEVNNEFLNSETLQKLETYKNKLSLFDDGHSRSFAEYGGIVMTKEQFQAQNAFLEKMRLLQDDNDESRKNMIAQYEYVLQLQQKVDEFHKRSLEKQNKIAALSKNNVSANIKKDTTPFISPQVQYGTDLGQKVLQWMNGKEIPVIKVPIEIDEQVDEEDLSGKWGEHIKKIEDMNTALGYTGEIFGSLGGIMSSFGDNMGAWLMSTIGNVAQMIVQLQSLATANGVTSASKLPFPANIAAIATVVATIASVFSGLPKFAEGGIVGGSSYIGDKLLARVNSGEMILNQGQQARLLSLTDNGSVRVSGDVKLSGKDIYISLRNYMSASGNRL